MAESYQNQYHIVTRKDLDSDLKFFLRMDELNEAASKLKGNAFKLYVYLAKNSNNYDFWFSSKDFMN